MKSPTILLALIAAPLTLTANTNAQGIYAEYYATNNPGDGWAPLPGFPSQDAGEPGLPSGSDLTIDAVGNQVIRIFSDEPSTIDIGVVTLNAQPGSAPTLLIANTSQHTLNPGAPLGQPACRTLAGVHADELSKIQINTHTISGPGIDVHQIVRLDLAGDLDAPIVHWGDLAASAPDMGDITIAGDITPKGSIAAYRGDIGAVHIQGDLNGHLIARAGTIDSIDVDGSIGSQGRPAILAKGQRGSMTIGHINVAGDIGRPDALADIITAGNLRTIEANAIHANIDLESDPDVPGYIALLDARTGDFSGSFKARSLTSFGGDSNSPCLVNIAGDLLGNITFTNVVRNENSSGPEIDIAGTVADGASIVIGSMPRTNSGLPAGQVVVRSEKALAGLVVVGKGNSIDFPTPASIQIGTQNPFTVTDSSKHYTTTFDALGGGGVAIAPFNFHENESFPNHNETITLEGNELLTAVAPRFFGPVYATDMGQHMIIEHLPEGVQDWIDRSNEFTLEAPTEDISGSRTIVIHAIAPASFTAGQWRIRPVDGALKSAMAITNPDVQFDSEYEDNTYRFNVAGGADCPQPPTPARSNDNEIDFTDSDGIIRVNCP